MRNRKAQGFTLIELLIVIAIIGILAAVLIPNLMSARDSAAARAAQAYSANVYTAGVAALAENVRWIPESIKPVNCMVAATTAITGGPAAADTNASNYSINAAPAGLTSCAITVANNDLVVTVIRNGVTFINGAQQ